VVRLLTGFVMAIAMAGGFAVVGPTVAAQGPPSAACQACREAFTTCMQTARTPAQAAVCRAAALKCLQENNCSFQ
jgi:hypothetical protein